jgi:hypothetical protein
MKRILLVVSLITVISVLGFSQVTVEEQPLVPFHAEIMAQGGSYTAIAQGYNALFTNPAGFSRESEGGSLSLLAANVWIHARPDMLLTSLQDFDGSGGEQEIAAILADQFTENGFGIGASSGIAYVGGNFGIGLSFVFDSFFSGRTFPLGQSGYMRSELSIIAGYALPLELGPLSVSIGADVRPFMRIHSMIDDATDLIATVLGVDTGAAVSDNVFDTINALNGSGIAFDAGLIAEIGPFAAGLTVRDIGNTAISYAQHSLQAVLDTLPQLGLPDTGHPTYAAVDGNYIVPMSFTFGLAFHPDFGDFAGILDPMVHAEIKDPFTLIGGTSGTSLWTKLHVGSQIKLFGFWNLWAGLNQGYVTFGTGLDLLFLDISAGIFTRELGKYPGDRPSSGASFEFAIRF